MVNAALLLFIEIQNGKPSENEATLTATFQGGVIKTFIVQGTTSAENIVSQLAGTVDTQEP